MVANTTFGFLAACAASVLLGVSLGATGHPVAALAGSCVPFLAFFVYFFGTWHNVPKNPDISVTGEDHYVAALTQRFMAAKGQLVSLNDVPTIGMPNSEQLPQAEEEGND